MSSFPAFSADRTVGAVQLGLACVALVLGLLAGLDPMLGIVAALGLAFAFLVLADLSVGVTIFAAIAFLDLVPIGGLSVTFAKAVGLLLAISWLATLTTSRGDQRDLISDHPVFVYCLLAFLGWAALSVVWAEDTGVAVTAAYRFALNLVLFVIVYTAVRESRHVVWVVTAFLVGALICAMVGLLGGSGSAAEDLSRLSGPGADPNQLAASLVAALALAAAFVAGLHRSPGARPLGVLAVVICTAGVLLSFSRTGLVALAVALVVAVVFGGRWRLAAVGLLLAVSVGVGTFLAFFADPVARARVTELDGGTGRSDIWTVGVRMIEANPLHGVGAGNFPVSSVHYLLEPGSLPDARFIVDKPKVAHNVYIGIWAELGAVGLALFVGIACFSLWCAIRAALAFKRTGDLRMELLARSLVVALVAMFAAGAFLSQESSKQLWLLSALGPSLLAIARAQEARGEPPEELPGYGERGAAVPA